MSGRRATGRFADRTDAGRRLGRLLAVRGVAADLVLAIPRGGLPVGRAVADALGVPLDVVVASKLGAPGNPELAVGAVWAATAARPERASGHAVAGEGSLWLDEDLAARHGMDASDVRRERDRELAAAREKARRYRGGRPPPDLTDRWVLVVDDGAATGSTAVAAVRGVRAGGAARVTLAVPVAPPGTVAALREEADEVVCLATPVPFGSVGRFYGDFEQVTDREAMAYLDDRQARGGRSSRPD